ncbi:PREDICTED: uncharacterized protein LOC108370734 [Rhagoletis zephyria]|uniref:uncharacterized protein LOC108370734 n=1 Tax=Rhagoletis zephyria TaxID=28612 RepID=UPI000811415E|nr:PREDICTED: uncharacterized protein LOC108370734 [Rhagoletis zephyria]
MNANFQLSTKVPDDKDLLKISNNGYIKDSHCLNKSAYEPSSSVCEEGLSRAMPLSTSSEISVNLPNSRDCWISKETFSSLLESVVKLDLKNSANKLAASVGVLAALSPIKSADGMLEQDFFELTKCQNAFGFDFKLVSKLRT